MGCKPARSPQSLSCGLAGDAGVRGILYLQLHALAAVPVVCFQTARDVEPAAPGHQPTAQIGVLGAPGDRLQLGAPRTPIWAVG